MKFHDFCIKLIPKWYKNKYKDRVCNRKHSSGYWFDFLTPKQLTTSKGKILFRWFNHYYWRTCKHKKGYYEGNFEYGGYNIPSDCLCEYDIFCSNCHEHVGHYAFGTYMMFYEKPKCSKVFLTRRKLIKTSDLEDIFDFKEDFTNDRKNKKLRKNK